MSNNYFNSKPDSIFEAAYAVLSGSTENQLFESWSDGFIDKYTQIVFNPKDNILTLTWRNYTQWPKKFKLSPEDAKKIMNYDDENRKRTINQMIKAGKLQKISE